MGSFYHLFLRTRVDTRLGVSSQVNSNSTWPATAGKLECIRTFNRVRFDISLRLSIAETESGRASQPLAGKYIHTFKRLRSVVLTLRHALAFVEPIRPQPSRGARTYLGAHYLHAHITQRARAVLRLLQKQHWRAPSGPTRLRWNLGPRALPWARNRSPLWGFGKGASGFPKHGDRLARDSFIARGTCPCIRGLDS
jgi:hypothetical protein